MADHDETPDASELSSKEQEIYDHRLDKARKWKELGANPYGNGFRPTHALGALAETYAAHTPEQLDALNLTVTVAGRVILNRSFGKMAFLKLRDHSGELQAMLNKGALGDAFELYKLTDTGDFVGVTGKLIRSKTGELTVQANEYRPLTKSLRPLPEKWHGLTDVEVRYRQRYLDLISNPEVKQAFLKRNLLVRHLREFLDGKVELTPGNVTTLAGDIVGTHDGLATYTIGQRRGLGIAAAKPQYVVALDVAKNAIVLGEEGDLYHRELSCDVAWMDADAVHASTPLLAQIRSRHPAEPVVCSRQRPCCRWRRRRMRSHARVISGGWLRGGGGHLLNRPFGG